MVRALLLVYQLVVEVWEIMMNVRVGRDGGVCFVHVNTVHVCSLC